MAELVTIVAAAAAGLAALVAGVWRSLRHERQQQKELLRRHETAVRIDRIRRRAEDEMLSSAGVIDVEAIEDD